ncbi:MAG: HAMP domain-containing histidine kinase, partial [Anaerotignum sp.]|nr:HAMP domain-containing histidine kinase [Anaerotignum sp.]
SLNEIMVSAKESSKGNFAYPLDLNKISPSFLNFAEDVANIQEGFKNAVDDAVKGERMKAELITNVSHDLKTPLTSIISYVDLLKNEKLENETASAYVDILYDKSYRLKQLIEDLIEASKASSGNLTVEKMRVDYKQLTLQAMGEMEDKTEAVGLTFKMSCPEPVYIDADGGHMWRILENLLSNVIKYSMPDSRVYVDIFKLDGYGVLVMKNISAAPIDFDETRLTERFVRGDESRTTEGSGLGLSITQSLAELQGGTFGIQVDGDLFKSIVSIPLWVDEAEESEDIIEKVEE